MAKLLWKTLPLLTFAWLALAVVFAGVFVIEEYDHEHIDAAGHPVSSHENCHICLEIQIALRLIEAFGRLALSAALIGFAIYTLSFIKPQRAFRPLKPVDLKVRFNC
jgi:predicted transporter